MIFHSDVETRDPKLLVSCSTEEEIFQKLGLAYVPPELREDAGEFATAEKGPTPTFNVTFVNVRAWARAV